jgi:hypothetical protein
MPYPKGWKNNRNAATGVEALELRTGHSSTAPYVFGTGDTDTGRISTVTRAGAALEFPDAYGFGEAWELRFRTADTGNGQFQGIFLQVRSDVANTSTIRGLEIQARQGADTIALGGLTGAQIAAYGAGTTGNITTMMGMDVQVSMDSDSTYTVTTLYGLRVKLQIEDGATVTSGYGIFIENESVSGGPTGAARMIAAIGIKATTATEGVFRYGIDSSQTEFTNGSGNEVVLWKFKGANGTTYYLKHDTDAATVLAVVTSDPTS